ncbi:MAG: RNA polymerase sigma factor [Marinilabiliales bacterium]|nr:RNA polymerase sigma factor [Marinilabiliales bacterium]
MVRIFQPFIEEWSVLPGNLERRRTRVGLHTRSEFRTLISYSVVTQLEEIIYKCRKGNSGAQTALYNLFASKMYGVCLRYARDKDEAQDILQEGFIRVFLKMDQYEFKGSFEGWMRKIMVNAALERFRKNDKLYPVEEIRVYESAEWADETTSAIDAADLMKMIQELPPRYKMVFNLYAIEGYSHQEIGELMNISEGTCKSNLSRARAILQKKVEEQYGIEDLKLKKVL